MGALAGGECAEGLAGTVATRRWRGCGSGRKVGLVVEVGVGRLTRAVGHEGVFVGRGNGDSWSRARMSEVHIGEASLKVFWQMVVLVGRCISGSSGVGFGARRVQARETMVQVVRHFCGESSQTNVRICVVSSYLLVVKAGCWFGSFWNEYLP